MLIMGMCRSQEYATYINEGSMMKIFELIWGRVRTYTITEWGFQLLGFTIVMVGREHKKGEAVK